MVVPSYGQTMKWKNACEVRRELNRQDKEGMTFYSQSDWYSPRQKGGLDSQFSEDTGKELFIYGVDFCYASGTWFSESYMKQCHDNLLSIVKEAWRESRAIPLFSWHLQNPYSPSDLKESIACRYHYDKKLYPDYPEEHQYVIREILSNTGGPCGYGRYKGPDSKEGYDNPRVWFEARCKEVAGIITEMKDDRGRPIPIILRLWHECEDKWPWWGVTSCTDEEYKEFFILTEMLIKKYAPKAQILWAYCTDRRWEDESDYLRRYPGDKYVDIMGYDDYSIGNEWNAENDPLERARCISRIAKAHKKPAAIFETANKNTETSEFFFRDKVSVLLKDDKTSIVLFQMWNSGRYITEGEKKDRAWMLEQPYIFIKGKKAL